MKWIAGFSSVLLFCIGLGSSICVAQAQAVHYVRCGALLDGKSDTARKNVVISVEGERIRDVGATATGDVIDLSRETCIPGMIGIRLAGPLLQ